MSFIVPALAPHAFARNHFGACLVPMSIADPGGAPATGIVFLRGAISRDPAGNPPRAPPGNLLHLFTLPAGMRPADERWLTCQVTGYISMCDGKPTLCIVRPSGRVLVEAGSIGYDGAVFFDGLSFFAERQDRTRKRPRKAPRARRS